MLFLLELIGGSIQQLSCKSIGHPSLSSRSNPLFTPYISSSLSNDPFSCLCSYPPVISPFAGPGAHSSRAILASQPLELLFGWTSMATHFTPHWIFTAKDCFTCFLLLLWWVSPFLSPFLCRAFWSSSFPLEDMAPRFLARLWWVERRARVLPAASCHLHL